MVDVHRALLNYINTLEHWQKRVEADDQAVEIDVNVLIEDLKAMASLAVTQSAESTLLTVDEVAKRWRVSKMTVYRLVENGALASLTLAKRTIRIPMEAVLEYEQRGK